MCRGNLSETKVKDSCLWENFFFNAVLMTLWIDLSLRNNMNSLGYACFVSESAFSSLLSTGIPCGWNVEPDSKHISEVLSSSDYYAANSALADQCATHSFSANTSKWAAVLDLVIWSGVGFPVRNLLSLWKTSFVFRDASSCSWNNWGLQMLHNILVFSVHESVLTACWAWWWKTKTQVVQHNLKASLTAVMLFGS